MSKWNIFSKNKKNSKIEQTDDEIIQDAFEEKPIAEYHETLYSDDSKGKRYAKTQNISDQSAWRNVELIEKNVDELHIKRAERPSSDVSRKVDRLFKKTKKTDRKPSNVIYVVSSPQPGQVTGDWAVRSHGKIFSHHRKKEKAIKEARKIARKKDATVMVQNTDGTFSEGFKPRTK